MPKIAYLDCSSGISGDMLLAALIDAGAKLDAIADCVASLGLPECRLSVEETRRHGFRALAARLDLPDEHAHRHLHQIAAMIDAGRMPAQAKETAKKIFTRLAQAEAKVHGTSVAQVHFHEVGAADSIIDIVGASVGLELLGIEKLFASPVPTGWGKIRIAHGECAIPAPATAELLQGVPLAAANVEGELTTPTGAAILASLVESFGPPPAMTIRAIGYGAGSRDWADRPNILRLMLGETAETEAAAGSDRVCQLETTLDDQTGESVGYCIERLWQAGALEVYTIAVGMKKNRPGVLLTVLCDLAAEETMKNTLFRETTTLGIRRTIVARHVLDREACTVETPWGMIAGKIAKLPDGTTRFSPEYESCRQAAQKSNQPLHQIYEAATLGFLNEKR
jgi:uncharacterized protein (TIGR00299 family) protein